MIPRETREAETRVAATPQTVSTLVNFGCRVWVQAGAGCHSGFSDRDYQSLGAEIVGEELEVYRSIHLILQVKRPADDLERAILANLPPHAAILGVLDPQAPCNDHVFEYQSGQLTTFTWEWLPQSDRTKSFDAIALMSRISGKIVVDEFMRNASISNLTNRRVLVIGLGNAGLAAVKQAIQYGGHVTGIATNSRFQSFLESWNCQFVQIPKDDLTAQQSRIRSVLLDSKCPFDLVVCAARRRGQLAPLLITAETLNQLKQPTVFYDLTASSGGNCEGNQFGKTVQIGDAVISNTTGYPKLNPQLSTPPYADCVLKFVTHLLGFNSQATSTIDDCLQSCLTTSGLIAPRLAEGSNPQQFFTQCKQWYEQFIKL